MQKIVIKWWESKRLLYNFWILGVGIGLLATLYLTGLIIGKPIYLFFFLVSSFLYALFLNLAFVVYWMLYLLMIKLKLLGIEDSIKTRSWSFYFFILISNLLSLTLFIDLLIRYRFI